MTIDEYVSKNFEAMRNLGIKGILCFWCRLMLILVPIINGIFSLYIVIIVSQKIWLSAIGGGLLAISVLLFLFSFASGTFIILCCIDIKIGKTTNLTFLIASISSIISLIIEACLLSQITKSKANLLINDLTDYCIRNYNDPIVHKFLANHASFYCVRRYVETRTTDLYGASATFFTIWLILFALHLLFIYLLSNPTIQINVNNDVTPSPDELHDLTPT